MKFFLYSKCGEGCGLAKKLQDEGNQVSIFIQEKEYKSVYKGILSQSKEPERGSIVIFDSSSIGARADYFKDKGFKVLGASSFHDKLELDRGFGLSVMQKYGIQTPETFEFESHQWKVAQDFIEKSDIEKFVFKPSGDLPSKLTYCSSDKDDLISYMNYVRDNFASEIDSFVLQEFIEGSVISSELWCGSKGFIYPMNHTVEVKKFLNDDLGPSTGCSGNLVWFGDDEIEEELRKIEDLLIEENYIGPIDLNAIVSDKGIYGLEWTPRFGLDAMPTFLQLICCDLGKFISDIVNGQTRDMEVLDKSCAGGVRLSIPPYPIEPSSLNLSEEASPNIGIPIRGLEECEENTYLYEVMLGSNGEYVHSAGTGVIAVISDTALSPEKTLELPYKILEGVKIPDKQYRTDLKEVLSKMYTEANERLC